MYKCILSMLQFFMIEPKRMFAQVFDGCWSLQEANKPPIHATCLIIVVGTYRMLIFTLG